MADNTLFFIALILIFGLVIPELFRKLQFPFVTTLIIMGAVLGPNGLNYVHSTASIELFGFMGAAFLMLSHGLEVKAFHFQEVKKSVIKMAIFNAGIPFIIGFLLVRALGYSGEVALLIGIVFMSSSISVIIAMMQNMGMTKHRIGQVIVHSVVLMDVASLLLLSVLIQQVRPTTMFPLGIYFGILVSSILVLKMFLPEITYYFFKRFGQRHDHYEGQVRTIITMLLVVILFYSGLGVHPIVAAFIVGIILSDVVKSKYILNKMHTMVYALFVPIFFFLIGTEMDIELVRNITAGNGIIIFIIVALLLSKFVSGYLSARNENFSVHDSAVFGVASNLKLTTTLSTTYAALELGLLDNILVTAILLVSVVSTLIVPYILNILSKRRGEIVAAA